MARAQVPGEVRGRVTAAQSGSAIPGARVEVVGRADYTRTDAAGAFVLRGLEPGTFTLRVRAVRYVPHEVEVDVANGRSLTVDVALSAAAAQLDPVVVASSRDTANALHFDRRAIEQSGRRELGELLQSLPGVVITRAGGAGSRSHISIRGSSASEVLVLVDGNPINSPMTGEADLSRINLEMVERVSVVPGAQSARYGSRALAGVVVIETRHPDRRLAGAASLGAFGERNVSLAVGGARSSHKSRSVVSLTAAHHDVRGDFAYPVPALRGGGTARRSNGDSRTSSILATAAIERSDIEPDALQLRAEWQAGARGLPGSIVQPSTTGRERDSRVAGGLDGRWTFGRIAFAANGDGTRERLRLADPAPPFGTIYDETTDANSVTATTTATGRIARVHLSVGAESRAVAVTSTMLAVDAPDRQHQWGISLGARTSHMTSGTELAGDLHARADWDSFLRGPTISPRATLSASRGWGTLSASVGSAYAPPSLADQFFHEGVLVRPNPRLQPERVRREIEVRATVGDRQVGFLDLGADVAAYRADVSGMILWTPDFQFVWSPANFDVRRSGWEASGHARAPSVGADIRGSVSRFDVRYSTFVLGGQVAYRPRTTANVVAGVTRRRIRAEIETRYIGSRRTVPGSELNLLEPYVLSDIRVSRAFSYASWRVDANVGVENVFNRAASMLVDYPFPGRAWTLALRMSR